MKSEKSSKVFRTVFTGEIKRFWALPVIAFIMLLISGPFLVIRKSVFIGDLKYPFADNGNLGFILVMIMLGIGTGLLVFNYLVNKRSANYVHSLPITRGKLFVTKFISGFVMMVMPLVGNAVIMIGLSGGVAAYIKMLFLQILICTVMYSITIFAAMISGNIVMHLFNAAFFNVLPALLLFIVMEYMEMLIYGFVVGIEMDKLIINSVAIGALVGSVNVYIIGAYIVLAIAILIISYILYTKRAVENTGESLVFKSGQLLLGIVTFLGASMFGIIVNIVYGEGGTAGMELYVGLAVGFFVTFVIMGIIIDKTPKIFTKKNMCTGVCTLAVIVILIVAMSSDIIGYNRKAVKSSDVNSAYIQMGMQYADIDGRIDADEYKVEKLTIKDGSLLKLRDRENIKNVCSIYNVLRTTTADYSDPSGDFGGMYLSLETKDGFLDRKFDGINKKTGVKIRPYLKNIFESKEVKDAFMLSNLKYNVDSVTYFNYVKNENDNGQEVPSEKIKSLIEAIDKDFAAMTYEEYAEGYSNWMDEEIFDVYTESSPKTIIVTKNSKHLRKWIKENMEKGRFK